MRANNGRMTHLRKGVAALALSVMFTAVACGDDTTQSTNCDGGGTTTSSASGSGGSVPVYMGADVAIGDEHACTIASDKVWCWGVNNWGQLGDGTTTDSATPVELALPKTNVPPAVEIVSGDDHSCALFATDPEGRDAVLYCWGRWAPGAPGVPVEFAAVAGNGTATRGLAAGARHTCVNYADRAYCWGDDADGQLGAPQGIGNERLALDDGVVRVWASRFRTCAARDDGSIWCWGNGVMAPEQVL